MLSKMDLNGKTKEGKKIMPRLSSPSLGIFGRK